MNTLWTFGDSQTFGHGCRIDGPLVEYYNQHKKEGDDIWPNILSKKLNFNSKNLGICGASNDTILDTIIDNYNYINENDIVIIGKTFYVRFDIPDLFHNELKSISGEVFSKRKEKKEWWFFQNFKTDEEIETIINFSYHFANNPLYRKRHDKRFDFIKKRLEEKNVKVFMWINDNSNKDTFFERIIVGSDGKIKDDHFSFNGHKNFADYMFNNINGIKQLI
jgi:hypothetical protein